MTSERSLLIRNAQVLTLDDAGTEWPRADIVIEAGRIAAIGPDAGANWTRPLAPAGDSGRLAYVRTLIGALEMLRRGVTAVHDDAYHVPIATADGIDAIMQAYADSGIRATVAIDQPNIVEYDKYPYLADLLPAEARRAMEAAPRQSGAELLALYQHLIDRWHGAADGRLAAAVSCSAPQRVTVDYFEGLSALSKQHDLPFNIHILETRLQRVLGQEKFGKSRVRYVHELGLLDERMMVIHAIWVDQDDIELIAQAGCTVAHNPVCNLRLGSGVMPWLALRDAGVPICLGSDEMNTDDSVNLWFVAKTAALLQTLTTPDYDQWPHHHRRRTCAARRDARADGRLPRPVATRRARSAAARTALPRDARSRIATRRRHAPHAVLNSPHSNPTRSPP